MVTASVAQLIEAFAERLAVADLAFGHGAADAKAEAALLVLGYLDAHPAAAEAPDALESLLRRRIEARNPGRPSHRPGVVRRALVRGGAGG